MRKLAAVAFVVTGLAVALAAYAKVQPGDTGDVRVQHAGSCLALRGVSFDLTKGTCSANIKLMNCVSYGLGCKCDESKVNSVASQEDCDDT